MNKITKKTVCMLLISALLIGCGNTSSTLPMTAKKFKKYMENMGLEVKDQTSTAADSTYQKIYVALNDSRYSFEYYFMQSDMAAEIVYQYAVTNLNNTYAEDETAIILEENKNSNQVYSVSATDYYCEVIEMENTVLFVTANINYATEVKNIIADMGY